MAATAPDIEALADELAALHETGGVVVPFSARDPIPTPQAGYRVAARLRAQRLARGWQPVGRKIGFTNRAIWPRYGVYEPIWGTVYEQTLIRASATQALVPLAGLAQPRIEPEICFGLRAAPPLSREPGALLEAIEWVAHAVEIVQCHHPDWRLALADSTADNGLHGRLVLGPTVSVRELPDLAKRLPAVQVELRKGEAVVERGTGANVLGSPLEALAFLAEVLSKQPDTAQLAAGEIVTTGTLTDAYPVAPGEHWSTTIEGLPLAGLELEFT